MAALRELQLMHACARNVRARNIKMTITQQLGTATRSRFGHYHDLDAPEDEVTVIDYRNGFELFVAYDDGHDVGKMFVYDFDRRGIASKGLVCSICRLNIEQCDNSNCLVNDVYKVKLHFAEIQFNDKEAFNSFGTWIFDVYIQGKLVLKNFNIVKEANGTCRPVIKNFNASVADNTLEIRFYWAGKGTTVIPTTGVYGPLISAISVCPSKLMQQAISLSLPLKFLQLNVMWNPMILENFLTLLSVSEMLQRGNIGGEVNADIQTKAEEVRDHPPDLNPVNHSSIGHSLLHDTLPSSLMSPSSQNVNPVNHSSINQSASDVIRPFSLMSPSSQACYPVNPSSTNQSSLNDNRPFPLMSPSSPACYPVNPSSINQSSLDGSRPFSLMSPSSQADDRRPFFFNVTLFPSSLRDRNGNWLLGYTVNVGIIDSLPAELWGIHEGIHLAIQ
ncbi:Malectin domain [Dillenia turbinata]|uniref:Malectin domain n=1 Tax=Dillenia turbinata TaxID=194707 RepID=A0AAN8UPV2_9MAGN